jgi:hypothetical protein
VAARGGSSSATLSRRWRDRRSPASGGTGREKAGGRSRVGLAEVAATGPAGRVTRSDVRLASQRQVPEGLSEPMGPGAADRQPADG